MTAWDTDEPRGLCPYCEKPCEVEARGIQFFCMNCGGEFEGDTEAVIAVLPTRPEEKKP